MDFGGHVPNLRLCVECSGTKETLEHISNLVQRELNVTDKT